MEPHSTPDEIRLDIQVEYIHLKYAANDDTGQLLTDGYLSGRLRPVRLAYDCRTELSSEHRWTARFCSNREQKSFRTMLDEPPIGRNVMEQHSNDGYLLCMPVVPVATDAGTTDPIDI
jgi:hypothetical protein